LPKTRLVTVSSVLRIIGPGVVSAKPKGAADVVMTGVRSPESADVEVVLGVDTHLDFHVAVALDNLGRRLGELTVPTTTKGYKRLVSWAEDFGPVRCAGVEGTSSYGAGLARYLTATGVAVVEVERPKRRHLRRNGKSDPIDAEAAARTVLAGETAGAPKSADGRVEMIRALRTARRSAVKARGQAANQLQALVVTAPDALRERLRRLSTRRLVAAACRFRPGTQPETPEAATKLALRSVARRHEALSEEIAELDVQLDRLVAEAAPELLALPAVGTDHAATLLIVAGDNPERLRSEASFASLCGASPVEASSGKVVRHRLNRGGNRDANRALHMICMVRMGQDRRTREYVARRTAEGKSKREILRCLKRYVAREVYRVLVVAVEASPLTTGYPGASSGRLSVMS
jgi:transposase